jgi:hypothetical protein
MEAIAARPGIRDIRSRTVLDRDVGVAMLSSMMRSLRPIVTTFRELLICREVDNGRTL